MPATSTTSENENPSAVGRFRSPHQLCGTLPSEIQSSPSLTLFRQRMKTYLFQKSFPDVLLWWVRVRGPRNNICYSGHVKYFSDWLIDWLKTPACRVSRLRCRFSGLNELVAENLISSLVINEEQYKQTRQLHNCDATVFNSLVNCSLRQLVQSQITLSASLS